MALFKSAFKKLATALTKTREGSTQTLRTLLTGQALSHALLADLERAMIQADIGVKTALELRKDIQAGWERGEIEDGDAALDFLKQQLTAYYPAQDRSLNFAPDGQGPTVILVAGINGAGKTTSIAKICKSLRDDGRSVLLAACDTFRAAAVEQLEVWSGRLGVEVIKGQQGGDPAAVAFDAAAAAVARGVDVLILDTAGRLHTQSHLMDQLAKIRRVVEKKIPGAPHEVILVIDATTGQNGVNQAKVFTQAIDVTGLFLSKLDGSARGGIVIAIREALNLPVKFIGTGETPQDVAPFDPEAFIQAMFTETVPRADPGT
ncbi:MAG: signal recognition particle-docking protein FtsY [Planctomycetota bacterium]